ncbi:MAG: nucleoside monophosphate kinase [Spirochaetota bacterium]
MKFVFFGAPGVGKGTMSIRASQEFKLPHISTGNIFRAAIRDGTPLGNAVKSILESGGLVPDDLTIKLVRERLALPDVEKGWMLDGYPRTIPQARALDADAAGYHVIVLEVPDPVIIERLSGRRMCPQCGRSYHLVHMPPAVPGICDQCGTALSVRDDDAEAAIRNRLAAYRALTAPLVEFYRERGTMITISAVNDADTVWNELRSVLAALMDDPSQQN